MDCVTLQAVHSNRAQSGASEGNLFSWYSPKSRLTQLSCSGVLWHARIKVNGRFSVSGVMPAPKKLC